MAKVNDGGPAFPTEHWAIGTERDPFTPTSGMTLRDWFAGQALVAMGTWMPRATNYEDFNAVRKARAEWAYAQADEMLKAREAQS